MNDLTRELIGICRFFDIYEREAVCCGTVTVPQCIVLNQLLEEGPWDISQLAELAGVTNSTMTRLVDGLERRGWTKRNRQSEDRRRVTVLLTGKGQKEAERLRDLTEDAIGAVLQQIPKKKHAQILESMRLVREAMTKTRSCCC